MGDRRRAGGQHPKLRQPLKDQYENMFPRLLNAVTTMAKISGSLRERLAWVVEDVVVFADQSVPRSIAPTYREFRDLVYSPKVPEAYRLHPDFPKSTKAFHLSPAKAKRAAELLARMFEKVANRRGWGEDELQLEERDTQ